MKKWSTVKATALFLAAASLAACGNNEEEQDVGTPEIPTALPEVPASNKLPDMKPGPALIQATQSWGMEAATYCKNFTTGNISNLVKPGDSSATKVALSDKSDAAERECLKAIERISQIGM